ncbi:undecaprenyl diphosphate synthase family protein [Mycobacterium sp. WMMD1722]|uniref:undecaprenyl diphosphate synthase family protein n=1 Tax=Mycobacterium sp. WMMD1722 TaxID=3404117 RepID=UPI003BF4ACEA
MPYPPQHVGLIPDGMRRWARQTSSSLEHSYHLGAGKTAEFVAAMAAEGVTEFSIFGLSRANLERTPTELNALYRAALDLLEERFSEALSGVDWTFRLIGERELLPTSLRDTAERLEKRHDGNRFRVNILAAYDPAHELQNAFRKAAVSGIDFESALDVPDLDVVIRTSPEKLLSGFLPWQSRNALLHFSEIPLNDLCVDEFIRIVKSLSSIEPLRGR